LKAEKLIDSKVLEQLIRAQIGGGCSRALRLAERHNLGLKISYETRDKGIR